jgi:hypothetical protein
MTIFINTKSCQTFLRWQNPNQWDGHSNAAQLCVFKSLPIWLYPFDLRSSRESSDLPGLFQFTCQCMNSETGPCLVIRLENTDITLQASYGKGGQLWTANTCPFTATKNNIHIRSSEITST